MESPCSPKSVDLLWFARVICTVLRCKLFKAANHVSTADPSSPVMSYGGKGVSKSGVKKSDHAIIYTGRYAPVETSIEAPVRGEEGMRPRAIRVDVDRKEDKLDEMSRIDFGKPHTIHHNLKVRSFGKVNRDSLPHLIYQFEAVWSRNDRRKNEQNRASSNPSISDVGPNRTSNNYGDIWKDAYDSLVTKGWSPEQASEFLRSRDSTNSS